MSNEDKHIDYDRLTAYITGEGTSEERQFIKNWIEASEENRHVFEQCRKILELDFTIETEGIEDIAPADNRFDTDKAWNNVAQKIIKPEKEAKIVDLPSQQDKHKKKQFAWIPVAASVLIISTLALTFFLLRDQNNQPIRIASNEGIYEYYLPDSSKVVLQEASEIVYNKAFDNKHRTLSLKGKAYFDVIRNEKIPFIINTQHGKVSVLGTSFLVEENDNNIIVEVEKGKVSLSSLSETSEATIILERNEKGVLDISNNTVHKTQLSSLNHLYWANKKLTYSQTPLQTALDELSVIFKKEIVYDPGAIANCRISAVFKDQHFEDILNSISISLQFDYTVKDNKVEISSHGCQTN
ncbi:FecR family protein [Fulvivirgaceae bacterium BMA10]|uniref:FecR family protein n=1 Tax=Splendidivirga corallicola TaxID=3051826 RepID=A0ABT8KQD9_9BACT|nr:FecR family protein [Fulvivirgaceae bacterium BMA10]